jgi:hypothetical protein
LKMSGASMSQEKLERCGRRLGIPDSGSLVGI